MTERAFLPDPDNAKEAKIAVRKAGREANEHARSLADRLAEVDIHQREARYLLERAGCSRAGEGERREVSTPTVGLARQPERVPFSLRLPNTGEGVIGCVGTAVG